MSEGSTPNFRNFLLTALMPVGTTLYVYYIATGEDCPNPIEEGVIHQPERPEGRSKRIENTGRPALRGFCRYFPVLC